MQKAPPRTAFPWIPVTVVFIIGLSAFILLQQLVAQAYKADERLANIKYSDELAKRVYRAQAGLGQFLASGDSSFVDSLSVLRTGAARQMDRLRTFQGQDVQTAQLSRLQSHVDSLFTNIYAQRDLRKASAVLGTEGLERVYLGRKLIWAIRADLRTFQKNENELGSPNAEYFVKLARLSKVAVVLAMLIIIAVIVVNDRAKSMTAP